LKIAVRYNTIIFKRKLMLITAYLLMLLKNILWDSSWWD